MGTFNVALDLRSVYLFFLLFLIPVCLVVSFVSRHGYYLPVCGLQDQVGVLDNSSSEVDLDSFFLLEYFVKHVRKWRKKVKKGGTR